jgi:nucleolin
VSRLSLEIFVQVTQYDAFVAIYVLVRCRFQDSGRPRGYAHIVFETEEGAKKALELDGKYLMKR